MWPELFSCEGKHVSLQPLHLDHEANLREAVQDGELYKLWYTHIPTPDGMADEINRRLNLQEEGSMLPFAVILKSTGKAIGMTTYMNIDSANRRLEIGSTWYRRSVQRSPVNTECKLLLLGHAFEKLDCIAVEFRTHCLNQQGRRGIERLGAKLDGILRSHTVTPEGVLRDTAVYSIIASEWPMVKTHLQWQLDKTRKDES
jgi:RimJ/RimL family protein N-acetyltransferase